MNTTRYLLLERKVLAHIFFSERLFDFKYVARVNLRKTEIRDTFILVRPVLLLHLLV